MRHGLIRHTDKHFQLPKGFYGLHTLFLVVAFTLLARIKEEKGILKVRMHRLVTRNADEALANLCSVLNETETILPVTDLRLFYKLVSC